MLLKNAPVYVEPLARIYAPLGTFYSRFGNDTADLTWQISPNDGIFLLILGSILRRSGSIFGPWRPDQGQTVVWNQACLAALGLGRQPIWPGRQLAQASASYTSHKVGV